MDSVVKLEQTNSSAVRLLDTVIAALTKPVYFISKILNVVALITAGLISVPIVINVLTRFFFDLSIMGIIEITELSMILIVFGSLAITQINKGHIRIDVLVKKFPQKAQNIIDVFNYVISFSLFIVLGWQLYVQVGVKSGLVSQALGIPISIFLLFASIGTLVFALVLFLDLLTAISKVLKEGGALWLIPAAIVAVVLLALPAILKALSVRIPGLTLGAFGFMLLLTLMFFRLPIAACMGMTGLLGMIVVTGKPQAALSMLGMSPYSTTASYVLGAVPLFILMGELAFRSGISQDLFDAAYKWLGRLPGGLAMASLVGCAGFSAVCGDTLATAATMGTVALPEMKKKNYSHALATGAIASGGTLGILIPPSMGFIFYAIIAEESIGKLFMAGLLPGLMLVVMFMLYVYIVAKRNPALAPPGEKTTLKEKLVSLKGVIGMLILIVLILGGIMTGFCSPVEGGAVGAAGAFLFALYKRSLTKENLIISIQKTVNVTCMLVAILIGVAILGYFLAATRLPLELAAFVAGLDVGPYVILLAVSILYIILGMVMNIIPLIMLTLPAIYPTILAVGFDPIWFGVITVLLMQIGQITPPVGVALFTINSVSPDISLETITKGAIPFVLIMFLAIILLAIFPQIVLIIPNLIFGT